MMDFVSWDDDIPNWMESHKKSSKPPTRSWWTPNFSGRTLHLRHFCAQISLPNFAPFFHGQCTFRWPWAWDPRGSHLPARLPRLSCWGLRRRPTSPYLGRIGYGLYRRPPSYVCWFINTMNTSINSSYISYIYHKPWNSATYKATERYLGGPILYWYKGILW